MDKSTLANALAAYLECAGASAQTLDELSVVFEAASLVGGDEATRLRTVGEMIVAWGNED